MSKDCKGGLSLNRMEYPDYINGLINAIFKEKEMELAQVRQERDSSQRTVRALRFRNITMEGRQRRLVRTLTKELNNAEGILDSTALENRQLRMKLAREKAMKERVVREYAEVFRRSMKVKQWILEGSMGQQHPCCQHQMVYWNSRNCIEAPLPILDQYRAILPKEDEDEEPVVVEELIEEITVESDTEKV